MNVLQHTSLPTPHSRAITSHISSQVFTTTTSLGYRYIPQVSFQALSAKGSSRKVGWGIKKTIHPVRASLVLLHTLSTRPQVVYQGKTLENSHNQAK